MQLPAFLRRLPLIFVFALLAPLASSAESVDPQGHSRPAGPCRIFWNAVRASDNAPLVAASAPMQANRTSVLNTNLTVPEENRPAIPQLTASLSPMARRPGVFELKVLVRVREVARNKKGKLKRSKRNIGALLPVRLGESQIASAADDPIRLTVRVEAAR